jgi:hypothetical protein
VQMSAAQLILIYMLAHEWRSRLQPILCVLEVIFASFFESLISKN